MNVKMTTKIYVGFGIILMSAVVIAIVGIQSLNGASNAFGKYRTLARQTNADGRVQANMLMTRIFAKNFVINATEDNIEGVQSRAQRTLEMIKLSTFLTEDNAARRLLVEDLEHDLQSYVEEFKKVTLWQGERNELVNGRLNVLGPETEQTLTKIMTSALDDGDTAAAYQAGVVLRSLLLGRLYANRFLIKNDDASVDRAMREFRDMEINVERLLSELQDPKRRELADTVRVLQSEYMDAFAKVRRVITSRNTIIRYQLDRIGPTVADRIERLKLAIKDEQDTLGPEVQASIIRAETITAITSGVAIIVGVIIALAIGRSLSRPIKTITQAAEAMAAGDFDQDVDTDRVDEIGTLARAFVAMRRAVDDKVESLEQEIVERERIEKNLASAQDALRTSNEELEARVIERTAELSEKEEQLRVALSNMSDGIFTLDGKNNYQMFNDRYLELEGLPGDVISVGSPVDTAIRRAVELGSFGGDDTDDHVQERITQLTSDDCSELESISPDGRTLHYRKSPLAEGGSIVMVSDITERKRAEKELNEAFNSISSSIMYASKIQKSILPASSFLSDQFDDHFVYWEPRDVVGGDMYWCHSWGNGTLMVLGDCTGHGVPGAFMTLISAGALERAMVDVTPGDVTSLVQTMHQMLRSAIGQDTGSGNADDGLELGVCYVDTKANELTFVGARFELFVVNSGHVELIRGNKKGIGYPEVPADFSFEATVVTVSPNTRFYMTTDGMVDQIDNTGRQRFTKKRFKDLLLAVQDKSMTEQRDAIHDAVIRHQGGAPRLDDVAVVGFSIGS